MVIQLIPLLKGDLIGFIDGTKPCPPIFTSSDSTDASTAKEDVAPSVNPEYKILLMTIRP